MLRKLDIINIDGMPGIGVSSQVSLLINHFKDLNKYIGTIDNNAESIDNFYKEANERLIKDPNMVILGDGSIAQSIQIDLQNGLKKRDFEDKYGEIVRNYEKMNHLYGVANILIIMNDIEECKSRIERRDRLLKETSDTIDFEKEKVIFEGLKKFDSYVFTINIKFYTLEVNKYDTILDIHYKILKLLKDNFEIKKPSV